MTIPQLTVVEWADKVGRGFAPYHPSGAPTNNEYWLAAQSLLEADLVAQPTVPHTPPHPVWSLRYVEVGRLGGHWCFAVQGRGGESFGVAGTCRFTFAPVEHHPSEVWQRDGAAEPDPQVVRRVLAALANDATRVLVPGTPAEVAAVIGAVLAALPAPVVRARTWATCLLQRPENQRPILTGALPEAFREADPGLARQLDHVRWPRLPDLTPPATEREQHRHDALDWLTGLALSGEAGALVRDSTATRLDQFLDAIVLDHLPTAQQVPHLLGTAAGRRRLRQQPDLVRRWAGSAPQLAYEHRGRLKHEPELWQAVVAGIVHARPPWLAALGPEAIEVLCAYSADPGERAEAVRDLLGSAPAAADALTQLGLSPWSAPDLFPDRAQAVAADLKRCRGVLSNHAARELDRQSRDRPRFVQEVAANLDVAVTPDSAAALLAAAPAVFQPRSSGDREAAEGLALQLALRSMSTSRPEAEQWLAEMLVAAWHRHDRLPDGSLRALMYGGLRGLATRRGGRPRVRDSALRHVCREIGVDSTAPEAVRDLLREDDSRPVYPSGRPSKEVFTRRRTVVMAAGGLAVVAVSALAFGLFGIGAGTTGTTGTSGSPSAPPASPTTGAAQVNPELPVAEVAEFVVGRYVTVQELQSGLQTSARDRPVAGVRLLCVADDPQEGASMARDVRNRILAGLPQLPQFAAVKDVPANWRRPRAGVTPGVNSCGVELTLG